MKVLGIGRYHEFKLMKPSNNHKVVHNSETYFVIMMNRTAKVDENQIKIYLTSASC